MKDSIVNLLEDFEKLAYKILMWVILVPKTIIKVVVDPGFVPAYVKRELNAGKGDQFDEYISPILLYLGVMLLPAIAVYFLPSFGMEHFTFREDSNISYSAYVQDEQGNIVRVNTAVEEGGSFGANNVEYHDIELGIKLSTKSDAYKHSHSFTWLIWECGNIDLNNGTCSDKKFYYGEKHEQQLGWICYKGSMFENDLLKHFDEEWKCLNSIDDEPSDQNWNPGDILPSDEHLVYDSFYVYYLPGGYLIEISSESREFGSPSVLVESYNSVGWLYASETVEDIYFNYQDNIYANDPGSVLRFLGINKDPEANSDKVGVNLADLLKSSDTITFALVLLIPPLLIAGAIGIFTRPKSTSDEDEPNGPKSYISGNALKEHFYQQCYYFVPVGLAFWAWYYSLNYYTYDIQYRAEWLWIPFALALIWFFVVEVLSIAEELSSRSRKSSFFILFGCIVVMFLVIRLGIAFSYNNDGFRKTAVWSYPGVGLFLTLGIIYVQFIRKRKDKKGAGLKMPDRSE